MTVSGDRGASLMTVTPLLSDDNWGNLMAVLPEGKEYPSGGGIYYHADCEPGHHAR
jgi:hypothetical protein